MTINSRDKGAQGEREWAAYLRDSFELPTRRGCQFAGGPDSPDVVGGIPGTHCEVKRVERLNIHQAMLQAIADCGDLIPYLAHRRNRTEWLVTIRAKDLKAFGNMLMMLTCHSEILQLLLSELVDRDLLYEVGTSEKEKQKWISVEDELPEEDIEVLCHIPTNTVCAEKTIMLLLRTRWVEDDGSLSKHWFWAFDDGDTTYDISQEVTHWMPLPSAPLAKQNLGTSEQVPYVAIGNGEPVPEHLKHLIQEVPSVRDDPEIGREQE